MSGFTSADMVKFVFDLTIVLLAVYKLSKDQAKAQKSALEAQQVSDAVLTQQLNTTNKTLQDIKSDLKTEIVALRKDQNKIWERVNENTITSARLAAIFDKHESK